MYVQTLWRRMREPLELSTIKLRQVYVFGIVAGVAAQVVWFFWLLFFGTFAFFGPITDLFETTPTWITFAIGSILAFALGVAVTIVAFLLLEKVTVVFARGFLLSVILNILLTILWMVFVLIDMYKIAHMYDL